MSHSLQKTEHYALFTAPAGSALSSLVEALKTVAENEPEVYLLADLSENSEVDTQWPEAFAAVHETMMNRNGLLVLIHPNHELMEAAEQAGLILVPSEHEAVEYVMMDQMEKQIDGI